MTAPLAVIILTILDTETGIEKNLTLNITDLSPNETRELVFKNIQFEGERKYQISVSIDNLQRWVDTDPEDDDLLNIDVEVGSVPADIPSWRDPVWGVVGFGLIFLFMLALLFYLIRRKL
jgi:hypothetical protein